MKNSNNGVTLIGIIITVVVMAGFISLPYINQVMELKQYGLNDSTAVNVGVIIEDGGLQFTAPIDTLSKP